MDCGHQRIRCTNNVFYCLDCGALLRFPTKKEIFPEGKTIVLPIPKVERAEKPEEKPAEPVKKAAKPRGRKAKK